MIKVTFLRRLLYILLLLLTLQERV